MRLWIVYGDLGLSIPTYGGVISAGLTLTLGAGAYLQIRQAGHSSGSSQPRRRKACLMLSTYLLKGIALDYSRRLPRCPVSPRNLSPMLIRRRFNWNSGGL